jgi:hypothetical protein
MKMSSRLRRISALRWVTATSVVVSIIAMASVRVDAECGCRGNASACYDLANPGSQTCKQSGDSICLNGARLLCNTFSGFCAQWTYTGPC